MGTLRKVFHVVPMVFILASSSGGISVSKAIPLECYREEPQGQASANDGHEGEKGTASSSILCKFRIIEEPSEAIKESNHYSLDPLCWDDGRDASGSTKTKCLEGTLQMKMTVESDESVSLPSTDERSNRKNEDKKEDKDLSNAGPRNKRTIVVGRASYGLPYAQHGSRVEVVLNQVPSDGDASSSSSSSSQQEWIDWYIDLAGAHYPLAGDDPNSADVRVQIELVINAYEHAIEALNRLDQQDSSKPSSLLSFENQILLASCYFHLAEAYLLDPEEYAEQTVEVLTFSYKRFKEILHDPNLERLERTAIESKFAEVASKLGIASMSHLDPMDTLPIWAKTMDPTTTQYVNVYRGRQPQQQTSYSSGKQSGNSKITLEMIQGYFDEAIQIFSRHLEDGGQSSKSSYGREYVWNRLVTPEDLKFQYAETLQQSGVLSSLQGQFVSAKKAYERALEIHYSLLETRDTSQGYYYLQQDKVYTQTLIADLHLSLSDVCLQLGDYPCAKKEYGDAMMVYMKHKIPVAPMMSGDVDAEFDAEIQEAHAILQDYRIGTGGASGGGRTRQRNELDGPLYGNGGNDDYYYAKDDELEAELLLSLGILYLSSGDVRAVYYLEQARDLLEKSKENRKSLAMGELMLSLAMALYQNEEFEKSKEVRWQALDLLQILYGDGINPYGSELSDKSTMLVDHEKKNPAKIITLDSFKDQIGAQNMTKMGLLQGEL